MKKKEIAVLYLLFTPFFLVACASSSIKEHAFVPHGSSCIQPAISSSYQTISKNGELLFPDEHISPLHPWKLVLPVPVPEKQKTISSKVIFVRENKGRTEVWIKQSTLNDDLTLPLSIQEKFFIYYPSEDRLEEIESVFDEIGHYDHPIYLGQKNIVWLMRTPLTDLTKTIIYQYDDTTKRFYPLNFQQSMPSKTRSAGVVSGEIVFDEQRDLFWFYVQNGNESAPYQFYSVNPKQLTVKKYHAVPPVFVPYGQILGEQSIAISPSGNIYLLFGNWDDKWTQSSFYIVKFIPEEDRFEDIPLSSLPRRGQPYLYVEPFFSIFVDQSENLWLGMQAWQTPDGIWHKILPPPELITTGPVDLGGYVLDNSPNLVLNSTDGRLWLEVKNGMVSYDPISEEWCWFTTYQGNIEEDADGNLWMVAGDELYKLSARSGERTEGWVILLTFLGVALIGAIAWYQWKQRKL